MNMKLLFPALCALMMCLVACDPNDLPEPNNSNTDNDPNAPQLSMTEIQTTVTGGEYDVEVTSSVVWFSECDREWVTLEPTMWGRNKWVTIKVAEGLENDTATVMFDNVYGSRYLTIYRVAPGKANGGFSVAENKQVKFAPGNLQYQASTNTWRFAEHQYDIVGDNNKNISSSYSGWIDLFGWGTGNNPTMTSRDSKDYNTFVDWGTNPIDSFAANTWRTLSRGEWAYLFTGRRYASILYGTATVNGQTGMVVMPDNTLIPIPFKAGMNGFSENQYSAQEWKTLESLGALFLPAAGTRSGTYAGFIGEYGRYWSCTQGDELNAGILYFNENRLLLNSDFGRESGRAVRLARDVE